MKNLFIVIIAIFLFSCTNENEIIKDSEWIRTSILFESETIDTVSNNERVKFSKDGYVIVNKYNIRGKYKIDNDLFTFISNDTLISSLKIVTLNHDEIILESTETWIKENNGLKFKSIYKRTIPLPEKPYDEVLYKLASFHEIGKADTLDNGKIFYNYIPSKYQSKKDNSSFELIYESPHKIEPKIKGVFDKSLGVLPKNETLNKYSTLCNCLINYYEWETLDLIIQMENSFENSYNDKDFLNVKIWITEK